MRLILIEPRLSHDPDADNLSVVRRLVEASGLELGAGDVLLLPERIHLSHSRARYEAEIIDLARSLGCAVIGGSHHEQRGPSQVNAGIAVDARGSLLGEYEKVRPYASERAGVVGGSSPGELVIAGRHVLVLVCADFWFFDLIAGATHLPDLVLVPALSVSRKPTPDYSRALWRHLAVARAYELGAYVGVSDWGHDSSLPMLSASGVGGLADPTATDPELLFQPVGAPGLRAYPLDFEALDAFRKDRMARGFFWKAPEPDGSTPSDGARHG